MKNIFLQIKELQEQYKSFIRSYQKFQNPTIKQWINDQIESGTFIYQKPVIDLIPQYKSGSTLEQLIQENELPVQISEIFQNNQRTAPISPYSHQDEAICKTHEGKNIIVSTGTGSGKSMCFWIPIVSYCLKTKEKEVKGVKALVIYPMNALANSQYNDIAKRLHGTGITVAKYTGEMKHTHEEAHNYLKNVLKREKIYDSEIISREDVQNTPPDILITNYKMLELILTRHFDRKIFRDNEKDVLKFLILDEIHTYRGNSGADVACLIRRVKQRLNIANPICIGTSATIEDTPGVKGNIIKQFAEDIFGEEFVDDFLIQAEYLEENTSEELLNLPTMIKVKEKDLDNFNGSLGNTLPLVKALLDNQNLIPPNPNEKTLGELLILHPSIRFIKTSIQEEGPQTISRLAENYQKELRPTFNLDDCELEIKASLLVGTFVQTKLEGKYRAIIIPKIHLFFTQGAVIYGCLISNDPNIMHLQIRGDKLCNECSTDEKIHYAYPLVFCKQCGAEYFGVREIDDGKLSPEYYNPFVSGTKLILGKTSTIGKEMSNLPIPEKWFLKNGVDISKKYRHKTPIKRKYCPECNILDSDCSHRNKFDVWAVPENFEFCPSCGVVHTKKTQRFKKFYSFDLVGRSTATDILVSNALKVLEKNEKRILIFSDNRQETAFQAGHLRDFERRITFQHLMVETLKDAHKNRDFLIPDECGRDIYQKIKEFRAIDEDKFKLPWKAGKNERRSEQYFKEYLEFLALSELKSSGYILHTGVEKYSLMKIQYTDLDDVINNERIWNDVPQVRNLTSEARYDLIRGILDDIRWWGAIKHNFLNNTRNKWGDWSDFIEEYFMQDPGRFLNYIYGYSDENFIHSKKFQGERVRTRKFSTPYSSLNKWLRFFVTDIKATIASELLLSIKDILIEHGYLAEHTLGKYHKHRNIIQVNPNKLELHYGTNPEIKYCYKCQRLYRFKSTNRCIRGLCGDLEDINWGKDYYYNLFNSQISLDSTIRPSEHNASLTIDDRADIENKFNEGILNVLVSSPTMELGIDIGDLSTVLLRNVPPDASRYAQRAGRAGRSDQPSFILVFCSSGLDTNRGPHDRFFYNNPEKIISGKIVPPQFELNNKILILKHINSIIIQILTQYAMIDRPPEEIFDVIKKNNHYSVKMKESYSEELEKPLRIHYDEILAAIKKVFSHELNQKKSDFDWLTESFIIPQVQNFINRLDQNFNYYKQVRSEYEQELDRLNKETRAIRDSSLNRRRNAVNNQLFKMSKGTDEFFIFNYLSDHGFLPNYGFSSSNISIQMYDNPKSMERIIQRENRIAIREFAPQNSIYYMGSKYYINQANFHSQSEDINIKKLFLCPHCMHIDFGSHVDTQQNCPSCGSTIIPSNDIQNSIKFPDMRASSGEYIGCEEEKRKIKYYDIVVNYKEQASKIQRFNISTLSKNILAKCSYEHDALIYNINRGKIKFDAESDQPEKFYYCIACNRWLTFKGKEKHITSENSQTCVNKAIEEDILGFKKGLTLFVKGSHDVMKFHFSCPEDIIEKGESLINEYYVTLKEVILQAILLTFNMSERELGGIILPIPDSKESVIIIYETEEGGIGALKSLFSNTIRYQRFLEMMSEVIHIKNIDSLEEYEDSCKRACYNCLLGYWNQRDHRYLNRQLVKTLIQELKNSKIEFISVDPIEVRLERLKNLLGKGPDSNLEKRVLNIMLRMKIPLPDEAQVPYKDKKDKNISVADYYYKNKNMCVFVDGPPHANLDVKEKDKEKRIKIRKKGYGIYEMDFYSNVEKNQHIKDELIELRLKEFSDYMDFGGDITPTEPKTTSGQEIIDKKSELLKLLEDFELKIRFFLKEQLTSFYGDDWWNLGISINLRENAEKRKEQKQRSEPRRKYDAIDFLNLIDYVYIISQKKNWAQVFQKLFREKYVIQAPFDRISNIRNDLAHNRFNKEDFEKCKAYIDDILKYLPDP